MNDQVFPVPGFLTNWSPPTKTEVLPEYLNGLKGSFFNEDPNYTESDWVTYKSALDRHFHRLKEFLDSNSLSIQNLVLGNVQSGKTGHLLANICWAHDNDFHLVILLSGNKITLNNQTYNRLVGNLPRNAAHIEKGSTKRGAGYDKSVSDMHSRITERFRDSGSPVPVFVLLKKYERIEALTDAINTLQVRYGQSLKVMILDDEADQVSPDNTASKRGPISKSGYAKSAPNSKSAHESIRRLREVIKGRHVYLSYTATPQALLHGDLDGMLQPRFCSTVPSGPTYVGIKELVEEDGSIVNVDSCKAVQKVQTPEEKNAAALEVAFADFVISCWLHKFHSSAFHGSIAAGNESCKQTSLQFLVHPSGNQSDHSAFYEQIMQIQKDWLSDMESPMIRQAFYESIFSPAFIDVLSRTEATSLLITEENAEKCWNFVSELLTIPKSLRVLLVNTEGKARLSNTGDENLFLPIENAQWQGPDAWILVGGDILGRGLTIPHLTTTLFLRNPQRPNFDTAVQQMRFCGYRRSYIKFLRVYAPGDICDDYIEAVQIDEMARSRAKVWDETSRDLKLDPPALRFIAPATSRYAPTRKSVISPYVSRSSSNSSSGFFSLQYIVSLDRLKENFESLAGFKNQHNFAENEDYVFAEVSSPDLKHLLSKWKVAAPESRDFKLFQELLDYTQTEGGLKEERFTVVIDNEIYFTDIFQDLITNSLSSTLVINKGKKWKKRHRSLTGIVHGMKFGLPAWTAPRENDYYDKFFVQALVGDSERSVRQKFLNRNVLHIRLFQLFDNHQADAVNLRNVGSTLNGDPKSLGMTLIAWLPESELEYWVHGQSHE